MMNDIYRNNKATIYCGCCAIFWLSYYSFVYYSFATGLHEPQYGFLFMIGPIFFILFVILLFTLIKSVKICITDCNKKNMYKDVEKNMKNTVINRKSRKKTKTFK
jgi:uncharacterized membrane protein